MGRRQTAYEAARTSGQLDVVRLLTERGVTGTPPAPEDEVITAVLAGDRATVDELGPDALGKAPAARPGLVMWAAVRTDPAAVRLTSSSAGMSPPRHAPITPGDEEWETTLHHAAGEGDVELACLLLDLGAPRTPATTASTAPRWTGHGTSTQPATAALLEPR